LDPEGQFLSAGLRANFIKFGMTKIFTNLNYSYGGYDASLCNDVMSEAKANVTQTLHIEAVRIVNPFWVL
jgi:hypothetical protein